MKVKLSVRILLLAHLGLTLLAFLIIAMIGVGALKGKSNQMVELKLQNETNESQLFSLAQYNKEIDRYGYINSIASAVIPGDKDQARAVLEIFKMAKESGIGIENLSFPASTLGSSASSTSTKPTSSTTPSSSASASKTKAPPISQAKPVEGIAGLYSIQLTITPQSGTQAPVSIRPTYAKFLKFLSKIENNRRTAQVSQVSINPLGENGRPTPYIGFSITINIFIKP
jgi:hypothetical protein